MQADNSIRGQISILKGTISEYIACMTLRYRYRDYIAQIFWHPQLNIVLQRRLDGIISKVYIKDGVQGLPLPYKYPLPDVEYYGKYISHWFTVIDFEDIISMVNITREQLEALKLISGVIRFMRLAAFKPGSYKEKIRKLKSLFNLNWTLDPISKTIMNFLQEKISDRNFLSKVFEPLTLSIDIVKFIKKDLYGYTKNRLKSELEYRARKTVISSFSEERIKDLKNLLKTIEAIPPDYIYELANDKNLAILLLYMLSYDIDTTLELLKRRILHKISERIIRHMDILSRLIMCSMSYDILVFIFDEFGLIKQVDIYEVKSSKNELIKYIKTIMGHKKYKSEQTIKKFSNIKTCLEEYARIYLMYVPPCIENGKLPEPQIVEITHSIE